MGRLEIANKCWRMVKRYTEGKGGNHCEDSIWNKNVRRKQRSDPRGTKAFVGRENHHLLGWGADMTVEQQGGQSLEKIEQELKNITVV